MCGVRSYLFRICIWLYNLFRRNMEGIKLNQERLNKVCYILGSYDYEELRLDFFKNFVYIVFSRGDSFIAKFILDEISEFMGDGFGCVAFSCGLSLMFERESPDEVLTIPEGLGAYDE